MRIDVFRTMLRCYHLEQEGVAFNDIPDGVRDRIAKLQNKQRLAERAIMTQGLFASDERENLNRYVYR